MRVVDKPTSKTQFTRSEKYLCSIQSDIKSHLKKSQIKNILTKYTQLEKLMKILCLFMDIFIVFLREVRSFQEKKCKCRLSQKSFLPQMFISKK